MHKLTEFYYNPVIRTHVITTAIHNFTSEQSCLLHAIPFRLTRAGRCYGDLIMYANVLESGKERRVSSIKTIDILSPKLQLCLIQ